MAASFPAAPYIGGPASAGQPEHYGRDRSVRDGNAGRAAYIRAMSNAPQIAEVAALVGDPARASMLCALLGGRALTATELSLAAGVSPQTTSGHLAKLSAANLLVQMKQGRHRYYRLSGPQVGQMLEGIMSVALNGPPRYQPK